MTDLPADINRKSIRSLNNAPGKKILDFLTNNGWEFLSKKYLTQISILGTKESEKVVTFVKIDNLAHLFIFISCDFLLVGIYN